MSSMKDIKQRMANVRTTQQIVKAMDMVSAAKLQKARQRLDGIRPLYQEVRNVIDELKNHEEARDHVFVMQREVKSTAYVIITSDMGLCGSYNTKVSEEALAHMNAGKNEKILAIGAKGSEYFRRRSKNVVRRITDVSEAQIYQGTERMSRLLASLYVSGEIDEVFVAYTHFESTLSHVPRVEKVLPIYDELREAPKGSRMKYEPDVSSFLDHTVPLYLHMYFFAAASESVACEHAARMVNMESAGKNAKEIIDDLNRMYNNKRQAAITQELNEIISGASVLK